MDTDRSVDSLTAESPSHAALEREIETALAIEPSPEFLARVRTRIAREPGPDAWYHGSRLASAGLVSIVVVMVTAGILWQGREPAAITSRGVVLERSESDRRASEFDREAGSFGRSDSRRRAGPFAPAEAGAIALAAAGARSRSRPGARKPAEEGEPEVLISAEESVAVRRLVEDISVKRVDVSSLPQPAPWTLVEPLADISIAPIAVEPLSLLGAL